MYSFNFFSINYFEREVYRKEGALNKVKKGARGKEAKIPLSPPLNKVVLSLI